MRPKPITMRLGEVNPAIRGMAAVLYADTLAQSIMLKEIVLPETAIGAAKKILTLIRLYTSLV